MDNKMKRIIPLIFGMMGCVCFGAGDWLMLYGDTAHRGALYWLTEGVAGIAPWRNSLAMFLAFPGIVFYGIGLFSVCSFIKEEKHRKIYRTLTTYGLTPWLCLHLCYIMILYVFAWLNRNGYEDAAIPAAEALFSHLSWLVILSEIIMLPPFLYWFYLQISGRTMFPKSMAFTNVLVIYGILSLVKSFMPDCAFRLGFTNGLMSESMIVWFGIMMVWAMICHGRKIQSA